MKGAITVVCPVALISCIGSATENLTENISAPVRGAFTCDFGLSSDLALERVAPTIERDRMFMAARPGFVRKSVPLNIESASGSMTSGGRYLFVDEADARDYETFVRTEFALDGVRFLERPIFVKPQCFSWRVLEYEDLAPVESQTIERVERFAGVTQDALTSMRRQWPAVRREAVTRGLTGLWLLYDRETEVAAVVYYARRFSSPAVLDVDGLENLAAQKQLGASFSSLGIHRVFDRTSFVLSSWSPFVPGDRGVESIWPNSPPLVHPSCGDGVCEVSRGEEMASCDSDCPALCGDATCQADGGETTHNCPGDCREESDDIVQDHAVAALRLKAVVRSTNLTFDQRALETTPGT